ncbi:Benzyl alcohol O-benzoyltransferase [Dichanthelium oligosanthes]|uniref:Benzyl alcohol O-benzoyltransferase n=1 Tax=Dichanthelium oligosanthes TaxID=888268 RepID=A0A1E5VFX1_9POAL|nr:Benzyl alcohol O-benzoyltransferase [Dichanthelium oligosanthes]
MPKDTAKAIRAALAEALVHYYPVAGRLRELSSGKLAVDCTQEGVVFVSAEADLELQELGMPLLLPFPRDGELVCNNVTQFKCGGFALGLHIMHCIADAFGWSQFMKGIVDLTRGEPVPLVQPVWQRELLTARSPPSIVSAYQAFKPLVEGSGVHDVLQSTPIESMACRCFLFCRREIAVLRSHVPAHLRQRCTDFDVLAAVTWLCRTAALGYEPSQKVYLYFPYSARGSRRSGFLHVPRGYYGNALLYKIMEVAVGELCAGGLSRAAQIVCEGKSVLTPEYAKSTVDLLASLRGSRLLFDGVYVVSDVTEFVGDGLDFGWGEWTGGGVVGPKLASFHTRCKDADGKESVVVSMVLPDVTMERFEEELAVWLNRDGQNRRRSLARAAL